MVYDPGCASKAKLLWDRFQDRLHNPLAQQNLVLIVVCIALLLDNMLYMVIVPIIPNFLRSLHHPAANADTDVTRRVNTTDVKFDTTLLRVDISVTTAASTGWGDNSSTVSSPPFQRSYENEEGAIGFLFASKAIIQLFVNPFTGTLIDRIGYSIPMMIGLVIMFLSTTVFAFGESYLVLFLARSMQGIGSAFADTSGLAMIADRFSEEAERTKALGIALAFISFGCLFAPPFGGILYQFAGKTVPFLILAAICFIDGLLLLTVMTPARLHGRGLFVEDDRPKGTPIYRLLVDPYIAVCAGILAMSNVSLAFLEPTLSLWMKDHMDADEWQMGFVWLPAFVPHIAGVYVTVKLARKYPEYQWLMAALGLAMEGLFCCVIPFARQFFVLVFPIMGICFGIALVDTAILPMLGHLVDVRHASVYGSVYALADIAYSLAYAVGPIVAGSVVHAIGFFWLNILIFTSNVVFAPVMIILRNTYKYSRFEDEEEEDTLEDEADKPDYQTYPRNGGKKGKPHPIKIVIDRRHSRRNREMDCYPPLSAEYGGYGNLRSPTFFAR